MRSAARGWTESFVALTGDTGKLLWARLAELAAILAVSWTVSRVLQLAASAVGIMVPSVKVEYDADFNRTEQQLAIWNQWAAVVLTSLSLLALLAGLIMALRTFSARSPQGFGPASGDSQSSLSHDLSLTLLAFLGIYSVFDEVQKIVDGVVSDALTLNMDIETTLFTPLNPSTWTDTFVVVGVIAAAFLLRRIVEARADKTGNQALGLLSAVLESFYLFAFFIVGRYLLLELRYWLLDRQAMLWLEDFVSWLGTPLRWLKLSLPELLGAAWTWFWEVGWPVVLSSFTQPLLWLALATLVLGSGVRTFGDLLASGDLRTSVSRRLPRAQKVAGAAAALERHGTAARRVQDAVFGNVDEKYLPIWQSLKLVLGGGAGLLGAFVVLYAIIGVAETWAGYGLLVLRGPRDFSTAEVLGNFSGLLTYVVFTSLRLSLFAATYQIAANAAAPAKDARASAAHDAEVPA